MAIGYSAPPNERQFHAVDYNNEKAIQGLLRFYYSLEAELEYKPNMELKCILLDIERAIDHSRLTERQREVVDLYMRGWEETVIGDKLGVTQQAINKNMLLACRKMSKYLLGGCK